MPAQTFASKNDRKHLPLVANQCLLLVVDLQWRLMPVIDAGADVLRNALLLGNAAQALGVPALATEQYPQGLGPNHPDIAALCARTIEKTTFGACGTPEFLPALHALSPCAEPTLLVVGCEAHVCVLQTVLQLAAQGFDVRVVSDAVGSRKAHSREIALERMRAAGISIVTTEMVVFEWLQDARHPKFRELLDRLR